jgi:hypothetical protein
MGLETHKSDGLAPYWEAEKLQPHLQEKHWRGLWPHAVNREAFYYHMAVKPGCRRIHRGTQEWLLYTWVCGILISGKFQNIVSQLLQEALGMEQKWCVKTQLSICPQKVQHLDQFLMKQGYSYKICYKETEIFSKCGAAKCMNIRTKIKYVPSVWVTTVSHFLEFYSIPFYSMSIVKTTNKALISKTVLLTSCKHGQKSQLNCALSRLSDMKGTTT